MHIVISPVFWIIAIHMQTQCPIRQCIEEYVLGVVLNGRHTMFSECPVKVHRSYSSDRSPRSRVRNNLHAYPTLVGLAVPATATLQLQEKNNREHFCAQPQAGSFCRDPKSARSVIESREPKQSPLLTNRSCGAKVGG